ncbi:MAG: (S)-ureidoglycine aminohydrolase [Chloroflexales bacterium]|nr:(S)-ureidoglycine aminohydrolase [Chloroflexales bacterium]
MTDLFGSTRSVATARYALFTPQGFVASALSGWSDAQCVAIIAPALGARFSQTMVTLAETGQGRGETGAGEALLFVIDGLVQASVGEQEELLAPGGFCYLPPDQRYLFRADAVASRLLLFQRRYTPLPGVPLPEPIFGSEQDVTGAPFLGDEAALLKTLLPDTPAFDMAVNIFTFQPGATLPFVETHVMEHGLLMLQGQGIYRLDADWHPVQAGDVIWMAPFCPQWFVATGKTPARYIYYKDVNRDPVL